MIVLDTHVILWTRLDEDRLGGNARVEIDRAWASEEVAVSAISFWEIALLQQKGRIRFPEDVAHWRRELLDQGIVEIAVNGSIAVRAIGLPEFHADPADRMIVATALEGHRLVTADRRILGWSGPLSRIRADR
ncbi:MAG: type II toxin-antitoxin system VapC family toxin [Deltaproteobacteria bacterium]|nr:type II toxin-antitoxin system VapC family toxin [Deltaproteobacteria bacterium]MDE0342202.1 type II toxin-antitoxin system VapC family toxin [Deltaproteobacteria bacterium]